MKNRQHNRYNCCGIMCALLFTLLTYFSFAQTPAQYIRKGDAAAEKGKWDEAFSYFDQAFKIDTPSFELTKKYAEAARHIKYYQLAEDLYAKNYQKDNGKLDPDGLYWQASMEKINGKYEDAQRNFKKYIKKHKTAGNKELVKRAEQEAKSALWAMEHNNDPKGRDSLFQNIRRSEFRNSVVDYSLNLIPKNVNSDQSEIAPIALNDKFFFSSYDQGKWWVKTAQLDSVIKNAVQPTMPEFRNVSKVIGTDSQNASNANFTILGDEVYFSRSEGDVTRIMTGTWKDGEVKDVKPFDLVNAEGSVNTMPCIAEYDGRKHLFFVSNREGGLGGLDIWQVTDEKGWSKPKNIGKRINTPGDEVTPFYNNNILYFSSDWHEGFGGMDVFVASRRGESFSAPHNAGKACNGSYNDIGLTISQEGKNPARYYYFSSNRPDTLTDGNFCCNDLYVIMVLPSNATTGNPIMTLDSLMQQLPVVLYFHNDEPNPDSWDTTTTLSYADAYNSYLKLIPTYLKENTRGLSREKREDAETITSDFFDLKVKKGMRDLELFSDLLLRELEAGRSLKISVRGFASPRAQSDYNLNLTKRRTASLVNFLRVDSSDVFLPYIEDRAENGAHLEFELLPFGEVKADASVSDDLVDEKNSIYVRSACLERKIEIESVSEISNTIKKAEFKMEEPEFDFGVIPKLGAVQHDFTILNEGNAPMVIDSVIAECGCTEPSLDKNVLLPGEKATLHIGFNPLSRQGKDVKHVAIYIAGEEPRILTIVAERAK